MGDERSGTVFEANLGELTAFWRRLHALIGCGIWMPEALALAGGESRNAEIAAAADQVRERALRGEGLAGGFGAYPELFPAIVTSLVEAGESAGVLDRAVSAVAGLLEAGLVPGPSAPTEERAPDLADRAGFWRRLSCLVDTHVPLPDAMELAAGECRSQGLVDALADIRGRVLGNEGLARALEESPVYFSPAVVRLVGAGESRDLGGEMLRAVAELFERGLVSEGDAERRPGAPAPADLAAFVRLLAVLTRAGVTLRDAVELAGGETRSRELADAATEVWEAVAQDSPLSEALERRPDVFPPAVVALVRAGERAGTSEDTYLVIAELLERGAVSLPGRAGREGEFSPRADQAGFWRTMSTLFGRGIPLVDALVIAGGEGRRAALAVAVARVVELLREGAHLSAALAEHGDVFRPCVVALVPAGRASGIMDEAFGRVADLLDRGYLMGEGEAGGGAASADGQADQAGFWRRLEALMRLGSPFSPSYELAAGECRSRELRDALAAVRERVAAGEPLARALQERPDVFPRAAMRLVAVGEEAGRLEEACAAVADALERGLLSVPDAEKRPGSPGWDDQARFWRLFAVLVRFGFPAAEAADFAGRENGNRELASAAAEIAEGMSGGAPISAAFAARADVFPAIVTRMVRAGEDTGRLEAALSEITALLEGGFVTGLAEPSPEASSGAGAAGRAGDDGSTGGGAARPGGDGAADGGVDLSELESLLLEESEPAALEPEEAGEEMDSAPVLRLVNRVLVDALDRGASTVHLVPTAEAMRVSLRVEGALDAVATVPRAYANAVVARIKIMANMDIAERRRPQDGRFIIRRGDRSPEFVASTVPSRHGETCVIRVIAGAPEAAPRTLDDLGCREDVLAKLRDAASASRGLVTVAGPTGSGKATTLHALLRETGPGESAAYSIEDPIRHESPDVRQIQVNERAGFGYAQALRAILRQDADSVLVGDVRDAETAELAVKAASTGILVLAGLHTNDAPSTVVRLVNMGVEPFLLADALVMAEAQRLVRKLCEACREAVPTSRERLLRAGLTEEEVASAGLFRPVGCGACRGGYSGRTPLVEAMPASERVREMISAGASAAGIRSAAVDEGMLTLRRYGLVEAAAGRTSLEEVLGATPAG